ncbi:MAG: hypothetical protein SGJ18_01960 [Pseudomonadota bacterium]|nr:hypothetical protein [Pseudomonadota bacterium]
MPLGSRNSLLNNAEAAEKKKKKKKKKKKSPKEAPVAEAPAPITEAAKSSPEDTQSIKEVNQLIKEEKFEVAAQKLYRLSRNPLLKNQREELKYKLGLTLMELGLNQVAAVEFLKVSVKGKSKYLKQSLEKLSIAADALDFDTLINLAISKIKVDEFPAIHKDMLYFRVGEFQMKNKDHDQAAKSFAKVAADSRYFMRAKYNQGLAFASANKPQESAVIFEELYNARATAPVNDPVRVSALIGKARALYQAKNWDESVETYRQIPRDTPAWHETLFESSWAMLRGAKFRSALSNFHSLHSPFYDKFYLPESLLLRSIVYLYICKFQELEKVLDLFENIYGPVRKSVLQFISQKPDAQEYFNEFEKVSEEGVDGKLPLLAIQKISKENDFRSNRNYLDKLNEELDRLDGMSAAFKQSPLGRYAKKLDQLRAKKTQKKLGKIIRRYLFDIKGEIRDMFEQVGFLRLEVLNTRKEEMKKEMRKEDDDKILAQENGMTKQVNEQDSRTFYVQNGYDYYPFQGEYWLDELGNYHYLGISSCK